MLKNECFGECLPIMFDYTNGSSLIVTIIAVSYVAMYIHTIITMYTALSYVCM